jgi:hypothetical protein
MLKILYIKYLACNTSTEKLKTDARDTYIEPHYCLLERAV